MTKKQPEGVTLKVAGCAFAANRHKVGKTLKVLIDGNNQSGRCVGRHFGQAPDIDSICYLTEMRPAGSFATCKVVDWKDYDLIVKPIRK